MDQAAAGAKALEAKDFEGAIKHYTQALTTNVKAVDYYIKRATAYTRVSPPNNLLALLDAETAVVLARERARRELIGQAQLRRGVALFGSERYADAAQCFAWAKNMLPKDNSLGMWQARVEMKSKDLPAGDHRAEVRVKEVPEIDLDDVLKTSSAAATATSAETAASASKPLASPIAGGDVAAKVPQNATTPADKIRHDWYQSAERVTLTLLAKGVDKDKAVIDIQSGALSITFPLASGADYDFSIDPFYAAVDPASSSYKVMSTKIEVYLKKINVGQKWHALEGTAPIASGGDASDAPVPPTGQAATSTAASAPAYPTSSKHGPKNWEKLATELTQKPKKADGTGTDPAEDSDDGGDPVNGFFKKLYKDASPETRRAMIKSYQESNGTALSTNWSEVSKGPVETTPPEGMEAKKW